MFVPLKLSIKFKTIAHLTDELAPLSELLGLHNQEVIAVCNKVKVLLIVMVDHSSHELHTLG